MCDKCNTRIHEGASKYGRREFTKAGATALAAAPLVGVAARTASTTESSNLPGRPPLSEEDTVEVLRSAL